MTLLCLSVGLPCWPSAGPCTWRCAAVRCTRGGTQGGTHREYTPGTPTPVHLTRTPSPVPLTVHHRSPLFGSHGMMSDVGRRMLVVGSRMSDLGCRMLVVGSRMSDVGSWHQIMDSGIRSWILASDHGFWHQIMDPGIRSWILASIMDPGINYAHSGTFCQ